MAQEYLFVYVCIYVFAWSRASVRAYTIMRALHTQCDRLSVYSCVRACVRAFVCAPVWSICIVLDTPRC